MPGLWVRASPGASYFWIFSLKEIKMFLPDRESNPGLPRDRRRSSPLDYRGLVLIRRTCHFMILNIIIGTYRCKCVKIKSAFLLFVGGRGGRGDKEMMDIGKQYFVIYEKTLSKEHPSSRIWTSDLWITAIFQLQSTALPTELSKVW